MNDSRAIESWRIESVWPTPPKTTFWCATSRAGGRSGSGRARCAPAVRFAVPEGHRASGRGEARSPRTPACGGRPGGRTPSSAPRRSRSWAQRQVRGADALELEKSAPVVPITQCTPASRQARALPSAASGVLKSTITSASPSTSGRPVSRRGSARPTSAMSSAPSTASQTVWLIRPAAPETATSIIPSASPRREDAATRTARRPPPSCRGPEERRTARRGRPPPPCRRPWRSRRGPRRRARRARPDQRPRPAVGFTCSDHLQPGSHVARPTVMPPISTTSKVPFSNSRRSSNRRMASSAITTVPD